MASPYDSNDSDDYNDDYSDDSDDYTIDVNDTNNTIDTKHNDSLHKKYVPIAINDDYGGFSLSREAQKILKEKDPSMRLSYSSPKFRASPHLIEIIRSMDKKAGDSCSSIIITTVPREYLERNAVTINEYDGKESIHLNHDRLALSYLNESNIEEMDQSELRELCRKMKRISRSKSQ